MEEGPHVFAGVPALKEAGRLRREAGGSGQPAVINLDKLLILPSLKLRRK